MQVQLLSNQSFATPMLRRYSAPRVTAVQPAQSGVAGGVRQTILCANCGEAGSDVTKVTIGGNLCTNVTAVAQGQDQPVSISCDAPPGAGHGKSVEVTTRGGRTSVSNGHFSYEAPSVSSIAPSEVLTGDVAYNVTVRGNNLGSVAEHLDWVSVGQQRCTETVFISSHEIVCVDVRAPWYDEDVIVQVAGQASTAVSLLVPHPDPRIVALVRSPSSQNNVAGGYWLNITGTGFGIASGDVVDVTIGGIPVPQVRWFSADMITVQVPPGVG